MRKLLLLLTLCLSASLSLAQSANINGILYAAEFGQWTMPTGQNGSYAWSGQNVCVVNSGGLSFQAFTVGTPVTIVDANPSHTETVTPSVVNTSGTGCTVQFSSAPLYAHFSYSIKSGTAGLQEAINWGLRQPNFNGLVQLTPEWSQQGGTTGMITAAKGSSTVSIFDFRTAQQQAYTWNGSAYVQVAVDPGAASLGGNNIFTGINTFTNSTLTKNLDAIRFAPLFPGATPADEITNCLADFTTGLCVAPPDMASGTTYPTANAKMLWDLRAGIFEADTYSTTDYTQPYRSYVLLDPAANTSQLQFGVSSEVSTKSTNSKTLNGSPIGMYASFNHFGSGAAGSVFGSAFEVLNAGPATVTEENGVNSNCRNGGVDAGHPVQTATNNGSVVNCRPFHANVFNTSSGTITNAQQFYAGSWTNTGGGSITNASNFFGADVTVGTNKWQLNLGAGLSQFRDVAQFDSYTAFGSTNDKTSSFIILAPQGIQSGATQWGFKAFPKFNTQATTFGVAVYGRSDTQAAAVTYDKITAYYAENPVKGVGSSINHNYGYFCGDMTAGSVDNYCIFSTGTAPSQFGGKVTALGGLDAFSVGITGAGPVSGVTTLSMNNALTGATSGAFSAGLTALSLNLNGSQVLNTTAQSGTGNLCMTINCTMTTPNIGAAVGTSLNLGSTGTLSTTATSGTGSILLGTQLSTTDSPGAITINAGTCTDRDVAIAGVTAGAVIMVAAGYALEANLVVGPGQSLSGHAHYRICNIQAAGNITTAAGTAFNVRVIE